MDGEGRLVQINAAFTAITGYDAEAMIGKAPPVSRAGEQGIALETLWNTLKTKGRWAGEILSRRKTGEIFPGWLDIAGVTDSDGSIYYIGLLSDLTHRKDLEQQLQFQAWHDPLTRLPNRRLLEMRLVQALAQAERHHYLVAVLLLDLRGFKTVNDRLGRDLGNQVLQSVADRLSKSLRAEDTLARAGDDEFIILLPQVKERGNVAALAGHLLGLFEQPIAAGGTGLRQGASIGIALFPSDGRTPEDLLRRADTAMYAAKHALAAHDQKTPGNYMFYGATKAVSLEQHSQQHQELERVLARKEFALYYQPQVELRTRRLVAAEALPRWRHAQRGASSSRDAPLAAPGDLGLALGDWVIEEACRQLAAWQAANLPLRLAVNLSARQFENEKLLTYVRHCLDMYGVDPQRLEFEITEALLAEKTAAARRFISACRALGITFAIDAFGIGYSSLTCLEELPVAALKIDPRFVARMLDNKKDWVIVKASIDAAHAMGLVVTAEGVETETQHLYLQELGCDLAQGFWISPPVTAEELAQRFKSP